VAAGARTGAGARDLRRSRCRPTSSSRGIAVKRLIEPGEVAAAVEFLCGAGAWALTGSVFAMDAGRLPH